MFDAMKRSRWALVFGVGLGLGCGDDGAADSTSTDGSSTTDDDDMMTTIPVTSVSATNASTSSGTTGATGTTGSESTAEGTTVEPTSSTDGSTTSGTGTTGGSTGSSGSSSGSSTDTGTGEFEVGWCILQFPAQIDTAPMVVTTTYARVYVEGLTDQTEFNDVDAALVSEFGYGDDGSDPAVAAWTWIPGIPNAGWDGSMAEGGLGQENNDEYQGDLSFPAAANYDYAARFSADGGTSWTYCDLDDSKTGGYSPEQAGAATIE